MQVCCLALTLALSACGRIGFDPLGDGDGGGSSSSISYLRSSSAGLANTATVSAMVTGAPGDLYLATVGTTPSRPITSLAGHGLTWTRLGDQCGEDAKAQIAVFAAVETSSASGAITATLASPANTVMLNISLYGGTDPGQPFGPAISFNHEGLGGGCGIGPVPQTYEHDVPVVPGGRAYVVIAVKGAQHTFDTSLTEHTFQSKGVGGDLLTLQGADRDAGSSTMVRVSGSMATTNREFAGVAFGLEP